MNGLGNLLTCHKPTNLKKERGHEPMVFWCVWRARAEKTLFKDVAPEGARSSPSKCFRAESVSVRSCLKKSLQIKGFLSIPPSFLFECFPFKMRRIHDLHVWFPKKMLKVPLRGTDWDVFVIEFFQRLIQKRKSNYSASFLLRKQAFSRHMKNFLLKWKSRLKKPRSFLMESRRTARMSQC